MSILEMKVDALMRCITADGREESARAREDLRRLMKESTGSFTGTGSPENEVRRVLLELGVPDHIKGHGYLVQAICLAVQDPVRGRNITRSGGVYPTVAQLNGTTPSRVERAIRHGIECAWARGDLDVLANYFGNTVADYRGKPTNSEFISRVANAIRMRHSEAA